MPNTQRTVEIPRRGPAKIVPAAEPIRKPSEWVRISDIGPYLTGGHAREVRRYCFMNPEEIQRTKEALELLAQEQRKYGGGEI